MFFDCFDFWEIFKKLKYSIDYTDIIVYNISIEINNTGLMKRGLYKEIIIMTKDMVLQKQDIDILKRWGYLDSDIPQIQEAIKVSTYELYKRLNPNAFDEDRSKLVKKLTAKEAYRRLGGETFLSGIGRSAFHWSSARDCVNENYFVLFDSEALFN